VLEASVQDSILVEESLGAAALLGASVQDSITAQDTPVLDATLYAVAQDSVELQEPVSAQLSSSAIFVAETLSLEEGFGLQGFLEGDIQFDGDDSLGTLYHETKIHPHLARFYMAVEQPRVLWTARAAHSRGYNEEEPEDDQTILIYDEANASGFDVQDWLPDLTCWIGSEEGLADRGKCRVREISTGSMKVSADMSCFWEIYDYITVVDTHELWPRPHRTEVDDEGETLSLWKDHDLEATERQEYAVPIMGPPACEFIDPDSGVATVQFYGDRSYVVQPDSSSYDSLGWTHQGITDYDWLFEGGTPSTSTEANPVVTYDTPGRYKVRLRAIRNGTAQRGFRNVFIFDRTGDNAPFTDFTDLKLKGSLNSGGWEASFTIFGSARVVDDFPPDAQVVIFAEQSFGGAAKTSSYGYPGRENILMVGWLADGPISIGPSGEVRMEMTLLGLQQQMETKQNYPAYFTMVDDEAHAWQYFDLDDSDPLTYRKAMYHYLRWHWTIHRFTDVYMADDHNNYTPGAIFPEGTLSQAIEQMVKDHQGRWGVDKNGALHIYTWPNTLPVTGAGLAWREAHQIIAVWNADDWTSMQINPRARQKVGQIKVEGVAAASNGWYGVVEATVPGNVRGFSGASTVISNQNLGTDDQAKELALAIYCEESRSIESVSLALCGNYSLVDIAPPSRVQVSYRPGVTVRDIDWTLKKFWVVSCELDCNVQNGYVKSTRVSLFPETEPHGRAYADVTGVGFVNRSAPVQSNSMYAFASYVAQGQEPDNNIVPALMGTGSGHVSTDKAGKTIVRLYGDPNKIVTADNHEFKEIDNRPVWVEINDGTRASPRLGAGLYQIVGVRQVSGDNDDIYSDQSYQIHRAVLPTSGNVAAGAVSQIALPVTGQDVRAMSFFASVVTAPAGADLVIQVNRNGSSIGTVTVGAGQTAGYYLLPTPVELEIGDVLTTIVLAGAVTNLVTTVVCREYGV